MTSPLTPTSIAERNHSQHVRYGFKQQENAFDWPRQQHPLPLFAYDINEEATKKYMTASYDEFYAYYGATDPLFRNHYEIVRHDYPTHLYVDIELALCDNPQLRDAGRLVVTSFERDMRDFLAEIFPQYVVDRQRDITYATLESSTPEKFSRHYVVKIRDAAFRNNYHVGAVMRRFIRYVLLKYGVPTDTDRFVNPYLAIPSAKLKTANTYARNFMHGLHCVIDAGVWTRNRIFRIYAAHKYGQNERTRKFWFPEEAAARCANESKEARRALPLRAIFNATLVQFFETPPLHELTSTEYDGSPADSTSDCWNFILDLLVNDTNRHLLKSVAPSASRQRSGEAVRVSSRTNTGTPLYTQLVSRLCEHVSRQFESCRARPMEFMEESDSLTISLDSTICEMLQRGEGRDRHNHNHVYAVVWFESGQWYQKCTSKSHACCTGTHSSIRQLPVELREACVEALEERHGGDARIELAGLI